MGVQLNIKDAETVQLAKELAGTSGRTVTAVIRAALERELQASRDDRERRKQEIKALTAEFRRLMPSEWHGMTSKQVMDAVYNEDGSFAS